MARLLLAAACAASILSSAGTAAVLVVRGTGPAAATDPYETLPELTAWIVVKTEPSEPAWIRIPELFVPPTTKSATKGTRSSRVTPNT